MNGRRWTPEDIEMLSSLAGDLPWPLVPAAFNRARPHRTEVALRRQAEKLGLLRRSVGQFITAGAIVAAGFSYPRVRRWILSGRLPARRFSSGRAPYFIRRQDLAAFARANPEQFGGLSEPQLIQLLDSERLAAEIAAMELPALRQAVPVVCIETGRRYHSLHAAASAAYVTPQRMRTAVIKGEAANGRHYRRVEPLGSSVA